MRSYRRWALTIALIAAAIFLVAFSFGDHGPTLAKTTSATRDGEGTAAHARESALLPAPSKHAGETKLPPVALPLKQSFAELQELAGEGNAEAASRLYAQMMSCNRKAQLQSRFQDSINALTPLADVPDRSEEERSQLISSIRKTREWMDLLQQRCEGIDQRELAQIVSITLQAARLGDKEARECYIHRGPLSNPQAAIVDPSMFDTYRNEVGPLIDAALAQGDWRVVDMLRFAYGPNGNSLLTGITGFDSSQQYRYTKLYRLGATNNGRAKMLDEELSTLGQTLTPAQIADADSWAQSSISHFTGSSTDAVPSAWDACGVSIPL